MASQNAYEAQGRIEWGPSASVVASRRSGRCAAILARLEAGPARTFDLMALGGSGFSSRIAELRRDGHQIVCNPDEEGAWYRLVRS